MKNPMRNFRRRFALDGNRLFLKLMLSLLLPSLAILVIIAVFFSYVYTAESMRDIQSNSMLTLSSIGKNMEYMFESSKNTAFEIFKSQHTLPLFSYSATITEKVNASSYLTNIITTNAGIYSVCIVKDGVVLLSIGASALLDEDEESINELIRKSPILEPVPRRLLSNTGRQDLISFICSDKIRSDCCIVLNLKSEIIDPSEYGAFLQHGQQFIIADRSGNVLAHTDESLFAANVASSQYFILASRENRTFGTLDTVIDGRRSVVSYLAVDDGKYFVFFISDYGAFYQKTLDTTRTILYFCAGIFIVLLLVSILISYKVYLPINDIFTNIWRMIKGKRTEEQAADPNLRHAAVAIGIAIEQLNNREQDGSLSADRHKNGYFRKLLLSEELPGGEIDREIAGYLPGFCGACVFAAVFRVDDHKAFCTGNTEEAVTFQLNSIGGLLENLLAQYGCVAFAPALDHLVAYLKTTVDEPAFKSASADIRKACDTVRPLFNVSLTVGVSSSGGPVGADGLRAMYREAYGYTNYRLIYGPGLLFGNRTVTTSVEKMEKAYKAADSIAASVKDLPPALFEKKIDELFSIIRAYRYESIMDVMIQIGDSLLKIVDGLQPRSHSISGIGTERFRQSVRECESLQEIKALLMEQYACINELISALKNTGSGDLLEAAVKFIEANYGNPSLSAAMISDMLGITPQYFSRLFRRLTSVSFPDYIKNVRLERAKSLLLANPYISISRLCEKVGYNSPSYFSSSFVKEYGVPPSKYIQLTRQISSQADSDFPKGR